MAPEKCIFSYIALKITKALWTLQKKVSVRYLRSIRGPPFSKNKMAFFSGGGQKAGFEFFKHFIKQQFDSSRMYQTIRVIRPKPKESSMDSYLSSMKQMPPSRSVYQNYLLLKISKF